MSDGSEFVVGQRVRVSTVGKEERVGVIVDDFGEAPGHPVTIGQVRIAEPSRRWAINLDDGGLVFVDSTDMHRMPD